MDKKRCFKCGAEKLRSEFYAHPQMGDGLLGKCKECTKKDSMSRYNQKLDLIIKYEKMRTATPERKEKRKAYLKKRDPVKLKALAKMHYALKTGRISKKQCEKCGSTTMVEGHHTDYSKPLDVVWLCRTHHKEAHGKKPWLDTAKH